MTPRIDWVLFDWGNVLIEYRPSGIPKLARALGTEVETLRQFNASTGFFRELTTGALSPEDALDRLTQRFGVTLTRAQVAACFRAEVEHELPGIRPLLAELAALGHCRLAILSNASFAHWDHFESTDLYRLFELPLSSHLIGAAKPSPAAYEIALQRMRAAPERVVFIDDKPANVEAALELGIHAFVTDSVATTRAGLATLLGIESR